jgi:hypothetical protein
MGSIIFQPCRSSVTHDVLAQPLVTEPASAHAEQPRQTVSFPL